MILTPAEVYAITLLAALMLGVILGAIGVFEEIAYDCRCLRARLLRLLGIISPSVPAREVWTSARRMPGRVETGLVTGGAPGAVTAWSSPAAPGAVPLDYIPPGWTRDARGLHPPAPRHASSERISCGGRVTERTVPRRRTLDRQPWETDHFAVIREEPYVPVYGEAPVAQLLEAERRAAS